MLIEEKKTGKRLNILPYHGKVLISRGTHVLVSEETPAVEVKEKKTKSKKAVSEETPAVENSTDNL